MHTVIRTYTGRPGFADELKRHAKAIEAEISQTPGFVSYSLIQTSDGAASITVCDDRAGCEESSKRAANWLRANMADVKINPPQVTGGDVSFRFGR